MIVSFGLLHQILEFTLQMVWVGFGEIVMVWRSHNNFWGEAHVISFLMVRECLDILERIFPLVHIDVKLIVIDLEIFGWGLIFRVLVRVRV